MFTEEEIEEELVKARNYCEKRSDKATTRNEQTVYRSKKVGFENLIEYGFARRVIDEARIDPRGKIAMTLRYGYEEAKRRLLAQARAKIRVNLRIRNRRSRRTLPYIGRTIPMRSRTRRILARRSRP
jgi:hypothetical protein